jgi:hypothetical protein
MCTGADQVQVVTFDLVDQQPIRFQVTVAMELPFSGERVVFVVGRKRAALGEFQILTKQKGNQMFVDGGFAGRIGELKKFQLRTGNHTLEFCDPKGQTYYIEQINLIAGKRLKIESDHIG